MKKITKADYEDDKLCCFGDSEKLYPMRGEGMSRFKFWGGIKSTKPRQTNWTKIGVISAIIFGILTLAVTLLMWHYPTPPWLERLLSL